MGGGIKTEQNHPVDTRPVKEKKEIVVGRFTVEEERVFDTERF